MLSIAVQHHPRRSELLPSLLSLLRPANVQIISDPEPDGVPNPWRTYRRALEMTPPWATHRLILQDDARPCPWFVEAATAALAARPDSLVVFCLCGKPLHAAHQARIAAAAGTRWIPLERNQFVPVIALAWPTRIIAPALAFVDAQPWPMDKFRSDDEIAGRIARGLREPVWVTVPSLVQHDDVVKSLIGLRARAGADPGRTAAVFVTDELDARTITWT